MIIFNKQNLKRVLLLILTLLFLSITLKVDAVEKIDEDLKELHNLSEDIYVDLVETIDKIEITGYKKPKKGQTVKKNLKDIDVVAEKIFVVKNIYWNVIGEDHPMKDNDIFETGNCYKLYIELELKENLKFNDNVNVVIDGNFEPNFKLCKVQNSNKATFSSELISADYSLGEILSGIFIGFIGISPLILVIIEIRKSKKQQISKESKEKIDKIVDIVKKKTEMTSYKISCEEGKDIDIYSSKFGGVPYWDLTMEYPTDSKGNKMPLLAQINFEKENLEDNKLPNEGILQFFIATDNLNGLNLEKPEKQIDYRVVYHIEIKENIKEEEIKSLNIPISTSLDSEKEEYFPFYKEYLLKFEKVKSAIGNGVYNFKNIVKEAFKTEFNENIENLYNDLPKEDYAYLMDSFELSGHKLLGYPDFCQQDPRIYNDEFKYYDTLLLQIDSESTIMWGDGGVANFFINSKDLKNKDFSKVLYNWDCG